MFHLEDHKSYSNVRMISITKNTGYWAYICLTMLAVQCLDAACDIQTSSTSLTNLKCVNAYFMWGFNIKMDILIYIKDAFRIDCINIFKFCICITGWEFYYESTSRI